MASIWVGSVCRVFQKTRNRPSISYCFNAHHRKLAFRGPILDCILLYWMIGNKVSQAGATHFNFLFSILLTYSLSLFKTYKLFCTRSSRRTRRTLWCCPRGIPCCSPIVEKPRRSVKAADFHKSIVSKISLQHMSSPCPGSCSVLCNWKWYKWK